MKKRTLSLTLCSLYLLATLPTGLFSVERDSGGCCGFPSSNNCFFPSSAKHASRHWISSANTDTRVVEIEDGSRWKLSSTYNLRSWKNNDTVTITPNHNTSSDYNYYVVNKSTGGYTEANLILGPVARGPLTHWAIGFDFAKNQVFLENDSCWKVQDNDSYIMQEWEPNDTIIIGSNDSWFSSFDTILINVNMNNYVRAKAY